MNRRSKSRSVKTGMEQTSTIRSAPPARPVGKLHTISETAERRSSQTIAESRRLLKSVHWRERAGSYREPFADQSTKTGNWSNFARWFFLRVSGPGSWLSSP
jgi:hypothetical protein